MKIPAKKTLGQHFLLNPTTIDKILRIAQVGETDQILEIGPGPGVMTERLAAKAARVVAIEKDRRFVSELREKMGHYPNLTLIEGDFLDQNLETILPGDKGKWKVTANLPYNIATEAVFHLLESSTLFDSFYLMLQREVAERIVASPGSKDYGILSIFTQLFSKNRIVMRLPPGAFTPSPRVQSAVVEFLVQEGCRFPILHLPTFESVVRAAFAQRRKMIHNTLRTALTQYSERQIGEALKKSGVSPEARAETVSIAQFVKLANSISLS